MFKDLKENQKQDRLEGIKIKDKKNPIFFTKNLQKTAAGISLLIGSVLIKPDLIQAEEILPTMESVKRHTFKKYPWLLSLQDQALQNALIEAFNSENQPEVKTISIKTDGAQSTETFNIVKKSNWAKIVQVVNGIAGTNDPFETYPEEYRHETTNANSETTVVFENLQLDGNALFQAGPILWIAYNANNQIVDINTIIPIPESKFSPDLLVKFQAENYSEKIEPIYWVTDGQNNYDLFSLETTGISKWSTIYPNGNEIIEMKNQDGQVYNNLTQYNDKFPYNDQQIIYNIELDGTLEALKNLDNPDNPFVAYALYNTFGELVSLRPIIKIQDNSHLISLSQEIQESLKNIPVENKIIATTGDENAENAWEIKLPQNCQIDQYINGVKSPSDPQSYLSKDVILNENGTVTYLYHDTNLDDPNLFQTGPILWVVYKNNQPIKVIIIEIKPSQTNENPYIENFSPELQEKLKYTETQPKITLTDGGYFDKKIDKAIKFTLSKNYPTAYIIYNNEIVTNSNGKPLELFSAGLMVKDQGEAYLKPQDLDETNWLGLSDTENNLAKRIDILFGDGNIQTSENYLAHYPVEIIPQDEIIVNEYVNSTLSFESNEEPFILDKDNNLIKINQFLSISWDKSNKTYSLNVAESQIILNKLRELDNNTFKIVNIDQNGQKKIHKIIVPEKPFFNESIQTISITSDSIKCNYPLSIDNKTPQSDLIYTLQYKKLGASSYTLSLSERTILTDNTVFPRTIYGLSPTTSYEICWTVKDSEGNTEKITKIIKTNDSIVINPTDPVAC